MRKRKGIARRRPSAAAFAVAMIAVLVSGCSGGGSGASSAPRPRTTPGPSPSTGSVGVAGRPPVYLHYYLWWTPQHWRDKLGSAYPLQASPLPVPGSLGANGCGGSVRFPGATVTDLPIEGTYDQNDPAVLDHHIATAAAAGVRGFAVAWQGTGDAKQQPSSSGYDTRLDLLVHRVDAYNATHAAPFNLALDMSAFGDYRRPSSALVADLTYFADRYANDPAFHSELSSKPLTMLLDSRKYTGSQVADVARAVGSRLFLISDDTDATWSREGRYFSGASWYWSSQNPYVNAHSTKQLQDLAQQVHAAHKLWFAPFAPGFEASLNGHSACTPRDGTTTLTRIWSLNSLSHPDAWFGISWNEFVENTYLEPSRTLGSQDLDALRGLIASQ